MHLSCSFSLPSEVLPSEEYDDSAGVLRAIEQHAATASTWRMRELAKAVTAEFPLLDGATAGYVELSGAIIDSLNIGASDAKWSKAALLTHPCNVIMSESPTLLVNLDQFEALDEVQRKILLRHEAVHIEQVIRGASRAVGITQWWEGVLWDGDIGDVVAGVHKDDPSALVKYFELPWEKEAYIRSEGEASYLSRLRKPWCRLVAAQHLTADHSEADVVAWMHDLLLDAGTHEGLIPAEIGPRGAEVVNATWSQMGFTMTDGQAARLCLVFEQLVPDWRATDSLDASRLREGLARAAMAMDAMQKKQSS
jgi:hypothetical protein